jgi:hypothetical protein
VEAGDVGSRGDRAVIKRFLFAATGEGATCGDLMAACRRAQSAAANAPGDVRPVRTAICRSLPDVLPDPRYEAIGIQWFADAAHLHRFKAWLDGPQSRSASLADDTVPDRAAISVLEADELVMRGAAWLDNRWRAGGDKLKHMAIARRAAGLSIEEFSERWKGRAGTLATAAGGSLVIPDRARGQAYVQNHPRPAPDGGPSYDAVNEAYFDDVESLRSRIAWFEENLRDGNDSDLVSEAWFVAVREEVVRG